MDSPAIHPPVEADVTQQPLEPADIALLRRLQRMLAAAVVSVSVIALVLTGTLAFLAGVLPDIPAGRGDASALIVFTVMGLAVVLVFIARAQAHNITMLRQLSALLRRPASVAKAVHRGELQSLASEDGAISYGLGGEPLAVWLPLPHANTDKLEFRKSVAELTGLQQQTVELQLLPIRGAPAPLLLRAAYLNYSPLAAERPATPDECREVAVWDFAGVDRFSKVLLSLVALLVAGIAFGLPGLAAVVLFGAALRLLLKARARRRIELAPRLLTVTGVVAEVLDSAVSVGRYTEQQRWYRVGDRLYPTGRRVPKDESIGCGSVVRMDYVDRGPRGGRILRIEPLGP
jgi:hypothetical protein